MFPADSERGIFSWGNRIDGLPGGGRSSAINAISLGLGLYTMAWVRAGAEEYPHTPFASARCRPRLLRNWEKKSLREVRQLGCCVSGLALDGEDLRGLPLSLRKTNLERLLARRPDGIFVAPFERGEIGPDLFRAACNMGLEGLTRAPQAVNGILISPDSDDG